MISGVEVDPNQPTQNVSSESAPVRLSLEGVSEWKVPFPIASTEPDAWNLGYLRILIWLLGGGVKDLDKGADKKLRSGVRKPGSFVNRSAMKRGADNSICFSQVNARDTHPHVSPVAAVALAC